MKFTKCILSLLSPCAFLALRLGPALCLLSALRLGPALCLLSTLCLGRALCLLSTFCLVPSLCLLPILRFPTLHLDPILSLGPDSRKKPPRYSKSHYANQFCHFNLSNGPPQKIFLETHKISIFGFQKRNFIFQDPNRIKKHIKQFERIKKVSGNSF